MALLALYQLSFLLSYSPLNETFPAEHILNMAHSMADIHGFPPVRPHFLAHLLGRASVMAWLHGFSPSFGLFSVCLEEPVITMMTVRNLRFAALSRLITTDLRPKFSALLLSFL